MCFLLCLYGLGHVRFQKQVLSVDNVFKTDWLEVMKIFISVLLTHKYGRSLKSFKSMKGKWIVFEDKFAPA